MRAIEMLMHEHRIIEKVMNALDRYTEKVEAGEDVPIADVSSFARFFREFADRCHHGKEENILFERMAASGFSKEAGPLAVMYHEHTMGRQHGKAIGEVGEQTEWTPELRAKFVDNARKYSPLLRSHILKEDSILYPMAIRQLGASEMESIAKECDAFEENVMGDGTHEQFHELAHVLIDQYCADGLPVCDGH